MMQSRSREKAMLATVSRLRRLLRKADLATKLVRVMGVKIFYTGESSLVDSWTPPPGGRARRPSLPPDFYTSGSGESLSQLATQYFPRRRPRHDFHKVDLARLFMVGEAVGDELAQFFV